MPFNAAIQPGPKAFDLDLNEFSITDERKQAVDFSAPYYDVKQAVVAPERHPVRERQGRRRRSRAPGWARRSAPPATTPSAPRSSRPPRPRCSTPTTTPSSRCRTGRWTRSSSTCRRRSTSPGAELQNGKIVGQLPATGTPEQFGAVLDKGSALTSCVSQAVDKLRDGRHADGAGAAVADRGGQRPRAEVTSRPGSGAAAERCRCGRGRCPSSARWPGSGWPTGGPAPGARRWSRSRRPSCSRPSCSSGSPAPRAGRGCSATFLDPRIAWSSLPSILAGLWLNIRVLVVTEIGVLALGLLIAVLRTLRGAGVLPAARARDRLRRPVPRRAAAHRALPDRLRGAGAAAAGRPDRRRRARHDHADPRLLRLRRRGLPRRDRVGAPLPAGRRALARAQPPPVDAAGDPPPGRAPGAAAAAQRLRGAAEGRRADLRARRGRRDPGRADRVGAHVQLHALRRRGAAVRRCSRCRPARIADAVARPRRAPAGA